MSPMSPKSPASAPKPSRRPGAGPTASSGAVSAASIPRPALPDGRPLGAHLPLGSGMVKAVERAHAIGADALQVFVDNPTAWRRRTELPADLPAFRQRLGELGLGPLAIHAAYLVNLAGPDPELFERSVGVLVREMEVAPAYGARFVNVHIGSHRGSGAAAGTTRIADGVQRVLDAVPDGPDGPVLVLENSAGGGDAIGTTVEELAAILEAIAGRGIPPARVGICLDTAHLWGAGYDVATPEGVDGIVTEFDRRIGLGRLHMIHLNDSKSARGSRTDRHQHLGAGQLGPDGLARLLVHPALAGVAYYLETPGMDDGYDAVNLGRARDLARGVALEQLPDHALDLAGSRARAAASS
jgi:deoxyribonuclease IV